jgi:general secretion pathway protein D
VLSITPHLVRNLQRPEAMASEFSAGTEANFRRKPDVSVRTVVAPPSRTAPVPAGTPTGAYAPGAQPAAVPQPPQLAAPQEAPPATTGVTTSSAQPGQASSVSLPPPAPAAPTPPAPPGSPPPAQTQ